MHTPGTSYTHTCCTHMPQNTTKINKIDIYVPHVCVYDVPGVCMYLGSPKNVKYNVRAFQRWLQDPLTRFRCCCSSICVRTAENRDFLQHGPKSSIFLENDDFSPKSRWTHRALGMSVFDARHGVGKEIVCTFHFLTFQKPHKYAHTSGTSNNHVQYFTNSMIFDVPGVCLVCAYNVPVVCTYLGVRTILKYSIRALQRRVATFSTTKTPFCSSN